MTSLARYGHPGIYCGLCLTGLWIPLFLLQFSVVPYYWDICQTFLRGALYFSGTFGLLRTPLKSGQCLFITGNFVPNASRSACGLPNKYTMNPSAQGPAGSFCWVLQSQARELNSGAFFCLPTSSFDLNFANLEQWEIGFGDGIGEGFPLLLLLQWRGETWRDRSGKHFILHKEKEKGNKVPVASCQAPGMHQPWELAPRQPPQRLLTWENSLSGCCQEFRQWAFG